MRMPEKAAPPSAALRPRRRAVDIFMSYPAAPPNFVSTPPPTITVTPVSPPITFPTTTSSSDLSTLPSFIPSVPRPIAKLPKRAQKFSQPIHRKVDLDLTSDAEAPSPKAHPSDIVELDDLDENISHRPDRQSRSEPQFVFNTNDLLATRQTRRSWQGSYQPGSWVLSREELHANQVDQDRALPAAMDAFPSYVSSYFNFTIFFFLSQSGHLRRRHAIFAPVPNVPVRSRNL